jgi:hypothetical protein
MVWHRTWGAGAAGALKFEIIGASKRAPFPNRMCTAQNFPGWARECSYDLVHYSDFVRIQGMQKQKHVIELESRRGA